MNLKRSRTRSECGAGGLQWVGRGSATFHLLYYSPDDAYRSATVLAAVVCFQLTDVYTKSLDRRTLFSLYDKLIYSKLYDGTMQILSCTRCSSSACFILYLFEMRKEGGGGGGGV